MFDLSATEFAIWHAYYIRHGFDVDRLEHVAANAGSACVSAAGTGAKIKPSELIPKFGPMSPAVLRAKREALISFLDGFTPERFATKG